MRPMLFSLAFLAYAGLAASSRVVHGELSLPLSAMGWRSVGLPDPSELIKLTVGIRAPAAGRAELQRLLLEVSDPANVNYGKHATAAEVDALVQPSSVDVDTVSQWILTADPALTLADLELSPSGDFISATLRVSKAEALLGAVYRKYEKVGSARTVLRVENYTLPSHIAALVDVVSPTIRFPAVLSPSFTPIDGLLGIGPNDLRTLYNIGSVQGKSPNNKQAALGFLKQYVSPTDVQKFFQTYYTPAIGRKATIIGNNTDNAPGVEADLDVEYSNIPTEFWSEAGVQPFNPENEPFLDWLTQVSKTPDATVPKVFSISYGDDEPGVNQDYADRVNTEFQKLGARGITVMLSSGDSGVGGQCPTGTFVPTFPATSPWVTGVGATNPENNAAAGFSGGGFSNYFQQPDYQKTAVAKYFSVASNLPKSTLYNAAGRGFPDVSAAGENFMIVYNGNSIGVAGTSCSAPTFSGIVALINDLRLQAGKSTLGFLNPFIYTNPTIFTDITVGNNPGCGTTGFYAAPGWDPLTGFGTPDYIKWAKLALSMQ